MNFIKIKVVALLPLLLLQFSCKNSVENRKTNPTEETPISYKKNKASLVLHSENYQNGKLKYIIHKKDSIFIFNNEEENCEELHITYYENGKVHERGCQGHYTVWGVPVGTWFTYDSLGLKRKEELFVHDSIKGLKKTVYFDSNGKVEKEIIVGYDPDFGELDTIWSEKKFN